jgi:hypothetical protein
MANIENNNLCDHAVSLDDHCEQCNLAQQAKIKIGATVKTAQGIVGIVVAEETELGHRYASIRFSPNGFCQQIHKDSLTVIDNPHTYCDGTTEWH